MDDMDEGLTGLTFDESLREAASWAHAETVLTGVDPRPFMPRPAHECSPFEVFAACIDALDVSTAGMTHARFVEVCMEEGITELEALAIWANKPLLHARLTEGRMRRISRKTLREMRALGVER